MSFKPIYTMMHAKNSYINRFGNYLAYLIQYRNMFNMMVEREFKGRFKNTIFGYFWHLLNPLSQILIYLLIFTVLFGREIPNYWVYVSTGMFAYSFFSIGCNTCCNVIINNANMVTKMTFAKEILIASKIASGFITLSISYSLLIILMLITGINITAYMLYLPIIMALLSIFTLGLSLLFSALTVYIRDIANAVSIIIGCLMFSIPIFYTADIILADPFLSTISMINPLYHFIDCIHCVIYYGICPNTFSIIICVISTITTLCLGLYVFKKLEKGFAERL